MPVPSFSGEAIRREATELAFPRYPGTAGDRRAIELMADRLRGAGLEVSVEPFDYDLAPVWRILRLMLVFGAVALVGAGWLVPRWPLLAAGVLLSAGLAGGSLLGWAEWLERLYRRRGGTVTANVEGRRSGGDDGPLLIFVAHHDSKSQNLTMLLRGMLTLVALGALAAQVGWIVADQLGGEVGAPILVPRIAGLLGGGSLGILSTLRSGNRSPGGVDNAGSMAILLALARSLPKRLAEPAELRFLSTGAEEDHMVGAIRWLERHFPDGPGARPTHVINLDGAGAPGRVCLLERYGFGTPFSRRLSRLARTVSAELGLRPRGVLLPPAMGIDAIPFAHRGFESVTLSSGSLDRATLAVHSADDVAENLDAETLERVCRLASGMAARLAEG